MRKFTVLAIGVLTLIMLSPEAMAAAKKGKGGKCGYDTVVGYDEAATPADKAKVCELHADGYLSGVQKCSEELKQREPRDRAKGPKGDESCRQVSEDAEGAYRQASKDADDPAKKAAICAKAKKELNSKLRGFDCGGADSKSDPAMAEKKPDEGKAPIHEASQGTPRVNCMNARGGFSDGHGSCSEEKAPIHGSESPNALAKARERYAEELKNNPKTRDLLNYQINKEVGSQGEKAQRAYIESVMNRAAAGGTGKTRSNNLGDIISDSSYYPKANRQLPSGHTATSGRYDALINDVISSGSNTCNYCTGASSGGWGGGTVVYSSNGENFKIEDYGFHRTWVNSMKRGGY